MTSFHLSYTQPLGPTTVDIASLLTRLLCPEHTQLTKKIHITISSQKNTSNSKDQASFFSPEPTCPIEMFIIENYIDEPQESGFFFKKKIINFKEFLEITDKKKINELKEKKIKENKCLSNNQENMKQNVR